METTVFYSETRDENFTLTQLNEMTLTELKDLFNEEKLAQHPDFTPIGKFTDKANAIRRVTALLTKITETDQDQDENTDTSNTETPDDPRLDQVTCVTCNHTDRKGNMVLVASNWYCGNEDECQARLNPETDPNEHNAPEGMVYCGLCKQHVPQDTAEPTADAGIYTCKVLCIGKKASSLKDKAKKAADSAKREPKAPKAKTERTYKHAAADIITVNVTTNPKKPGSASYERFAQYTSGMTVAEALKAGVTRGDFDWDAARNFITITPANNTTPTA